MLGGSHLTYKKAYSIRGENHRFLKTKTNHPPSPPSPPADNLPPVSARHEVPKQPRPSCPCEARGAEAISAGQGRFPRFPIRYARGLPVTAMKEIEERFDFRMASDFARTWPVSIPEAPRQSGRGLTQVTKASFARELQEPIVQCFDGAVQTCTGKGRNAASLRPHNPDSGAARGNALLDPTVEPEAVASFTRLAFLHPLECELWSCNKCKTLREESTGPNRVCATRHCFSPHVIP